MVKELYMSQVTTKKDKLVLMLLLVILNFIIRVPSIPHQKGVDSYYIQSIANSLSIFGEANWWIHWSSIFGAYPYSYASSLPFMLSGTSQLTGLTDLGMEISILLFSVMLGVFSIFTSFIFAGLLRSDFMFKYIVALFFSVSQGVLIFTTWEPSSRGPFIVFLPLAMFLLMMNKLPYRKLLLTILMAIFLFATHNYFFFFVIIAFIYAFLKVLSYIDISNKKILSKSHLNFLIFFLLIGSLLFPFFTRFMVTAGSRYIWIIDAFIISVRYMGPILLLLIPGLIYFIFKENKKYNEYLILIISIAFFPFIYNTTYGIYILLLFFVVFAATAFTNVSNYSKKSTYIQIFCIVLILSFVFYSTYYNHYRTGQFAGQWYTDESVYQAGEWGFSYIPSESYGFSHGLVAHRFFSITGGHPIMPLGGVSDLAYGLIDISQIEPNKVGMTSSYFYFEGFYSDSNYINLAGRVNWILENDIDHRGVQSILDQYNFSYFIMPRYSSTPGEISIRKKKNSVFDNGVVSIWRI